LRSGALIVVCLGALISFILTLKAGEKNHSILLPLLFIVWVLSPFAVQILAFTKSKNWPRKQAIVLYILMLLLPAISSFSYSGLIHLPGSKPASLFLITPLLSWLTIGVTMTAARWFGRKNTEPMD